MTAPPPYGRSPRVPGPREVAQTYFLVGNNNLHPHLLYTLLLPTRTGNAPDHLSEFEEALEHNDPSGWVVGISDKLLTNRHHIWFVLANKCDHCYHDIKFYVLCDFVVIVFFS